MCLKPDLCVASTKWQEFIRKFLCVEDEHDMHSVDEFVVCQYCHGFNGAHGRFGVCQSNLN